MDIAKVAAAGSAQAVNGIRSTGQPDATTLSVFAAGGYVAVVDLRGEHEERGFDEQMVVEELGLDYVQLPIVEGAEISFENASFLDQILADYDGPVLLHCASGNRVGALLALRESLKGADDDAALAYGRSVGLTGLEAIVRQRLQEAK